MKLQTKKIIAREFLLLTIALTSGLICFLFTYPYNKYRNGQASKLDIIIATKTKISDSLSYQYDSKSQNRNWFFGKYSEKFGFNQNQNKDYWNLLYHFAEKDSLKFKWNRWTKELVDFNNQLGFNTPQKLTEFFLTNRITNKDSFNYLQSQKVMNDIVELKAQKKLVQEKVLTFNEQVKLGITTLIALAIILFAIRYIFYSVRWSINILKQQN